MEWRLSLSSYRVAPPLKREETVRSHLASDMMQEATHRSRRISWWGYEHAERRADSAGNHSQSGADFQSKRLRRGSLVRPHASDGAGEGRDLPALPQQRGASSRGVRL